MKAKLLMEIVVLGKEITKENLISDEILTYKAIKNKQIRDLNTVKPGVFDVDPELSYYEPKIKKSKETKKPTIEITLEIWKNNKNIAEIASERKLTETTIYGHLGKLIQQEYLKLTDVLPEEKIKQLQVLFKYFKGDSLSELKESVGDKFTWEELKLYKVQLKD